MNKDKIIVALDVDSADAAREIVGELRGAVGAFKIGLQLFTAAGAPFVRELVEGGEKIFLDVKFHDIPNTVVKASVEVARLGVWTFNLHTLGGSEMMRRAASEVREICAKENLSQPKIIGVTILTSADQETLSEIGIESGVPEQVLRLAKLAEKSGLDGVVASPNEIESIRRAVGEDFLIVTPGIRPLTPDPNDDDQKRVMTPGQALEKGADYLVVGRPILRAENRLRAVESILQESFR